MAIETSTANNPASPGTGGTGSGGAAPIERMFADVAGSAGEIQREQPQERPSEREPQRRAPKPQERETDEPEGDEPEGEDDDLDDLGVDDKSKPKDKGDEDDDEENEGEEGEEPDADEDPEIDLDGKGTKVKLSEVKTGYLRQQDYTRKTTELSEERQLVHTYAGEIKAERDTLLEAAKGLNALALALQPSQEVWDQLKAGDPKAFIAAQDEWKKVEGVRGQILKAARDALILEQQNAEKSKALSIQEENRKLKEIMPAIFDPVKGPKIQERIFKYGERIGYSRDDLAQSFDHREILTLWKAMRYDEIKGQTPDLGKPQKRRNGEGRAPAPVQGNRPAERPPQPARGIVRQQADRRERRKAAEASLRRTGSVDDAALVMTEMLRGG